MKQEITKESLTKLYKPKSNNLLILDYKPHGIGSKTNVHFIILHKTPVTYVSKNYPTVVFRVIPMYRDIAVSEDAKIINTNTDTLINIYLVGLYNKVHLYSILDNRTMLVGVNRLVAYGWCPNDDYIKNNIVDHLDDNRLNNRKYNLKWTSNGKNVAKRINDTNSPRYLIKNIDTGIIYKKYSLREIGLLLNKGISSWNKSKLPIIVNNKTGNWIIEDSAKFTNWSLESEIDSIIYPYQIFKDKYVYKFKLLRECYRYFNIPTTKETIENLKFNLKILGLRYKIYISPERKLYDIKNIKTGEVITNVTFNDLVIITKSNSNTLATRCNKKYRYGVPINGFIIKIYTDDDFPVLKRHVSKNVSLCIYFNGEQKYFNSLRKASLFFNIDRHTLKKRLKTNVYKTCSHPN